jgi:hypothetical protein
MPDYEPERAGPHHAADTALKERKQTACCFGWEEEGQPNDLPSQEGEAFA